MEVNLRAMELKSCSDKENEEWEQKATKVN